jgi:hypothetical protein
MEFQNDQQKVEFVAHLLKGTFTREEVELGLIYYCDACNQWERKNIYFHPLLSKFNCKYNHTVVNLGEY